MEKNKEIEEINKEKFNIFEYIKPFIIGLIVAILLKTFIFEPSQVNGTSMYPTFNDGNLVIVEKVIKFTNNYKMGDIITFNSNDALAPIYIKRVIAKENDHLIIRNNKVIVNGKELKETYLSKDMETLGDIDIIVPKNNLFVMGDNRTNSKDSRIIGTITFNQVRGKVIFKLPFSKK